MGKYITTQEIIEKGFELNKKHAEYKNATDKDKKKKWQDFYTASQEYRSEVSEYVRNNPADISDSL